MHSIAHLACDASSATPFVRRPHHHEAPLPQQWLQHAMMGTCPDSAKILRLPRSLVLDSRLVGVLLAEALRAGDIHVACPAHLAFQPERAEDLVRKLALVLVTHHLGVASALCIYGRLD